MLTYKEPHIKFHLRPVGSRGSGTWVEVIKLRNLIGSLIFTKKYITKTTYQALSRPHECKDQLPN